MRTDPINSENRIVSMPKAGALGALAGYVATYAIPLTTEEHANYFTETVKKGIQNKAKEARGTEIRLIEEELKNDNIKPLVKDIFEKSKEALANDPKTVLKELHGNKEIEHSVKKSLTSFFKRVKNSGKVTEIKETMATSLAAKKENRVALYGAVVGAFAFMSLAVLKNALNTFLPAKKTEKNISKHEMTDLDYIIDCAEGPATIYICGFGKNSKK